MLEPRKRYAPAGKIEFAAIYATPLPVFAAAHSFPWSSDGGVGLDVIHGNVSISVPKELKSRLLVPISIYKVPSDGFENTKEEMTGYTWHATRSVEVIEEVRYPSAEAALLELGSELEYV
ncbi:MAG: hypothetical protein JWO73_186 [Candidatus Taylorbacteria bacterium]|nr:hypothetical protein [Candidatus Taylorbacteria bacterium]